MRRGETVTKKSAALESGKSAAAKSAALERRNIKAELEELDYPVGFSSVDGTVKYGAPRVNYAARLFNNYQKSRNTNMLDAACKQGWHDALKERTEINCKLIVDDTIPEHHKVEAKETLLADLEMLSMYYWSMGSIHACRILLDIGNYYGNKEAKTGEKDEFATQANTYRELSASYFYRAKLLAKESDSEYLAKILYDIADLDIELENFIKWGRDKLLILIDDARRPKLEGDQTKLVDNWLHKHI